MGEKVTAMLPLAWTRVVAGNGEKWSRPGSGDPALTDGMRSGGRSQVEADFTVPTGALAVLAQSSPGQPLPPRCLPFLGHLALATFRAQMLRQGW